MDCAKEFHINISKNLILLYLTLSFGIGCYSQDNATVPDYFKIKWMVDKYENCGYELSLEVDTFQLSQFYSNDPYIVYRMVLTRNQKRNIMRIFSSPGKYIPIRSLCPEGWNVSFNKDGNWIESVDSCLTNDETLVQYLFSLSPIRLNFTLYANAKWAFNLLELPEINPDYDYTRFRNWKKIELKISHSGWHDITDENWTIHIQGNNIICFSQGMEVGKRILTTTEINKINTYLSKIDFNSRFTYYVDVADQEAVKLIVDGLVLCIESPIVENYTETIFSRYCEIIDYIRRLSPIYK